jgi:hypothetical protein
MSQASTTQGSDPPAIQLGGHPQAHDVNKQQQKVTTGVF